MSTQHTPHEPSRCHRIDLLDPSQACQALAITDVALLALVHESRLPAYDLGGHIRFRANEVAAVVRQGAVSAA